MSDYNSALPIRSQGDATEKVQVRILDKTVDANQLAVNADGSVNITDNSGSLTVDAVNLDIRDLTHVSDSVKVGDGTDFLAINADGSINITDNGGSLTVDAVDLDIRNLVFATDKVDVSGSSVTVTATDLDIRDLDAAQDNVAISDGTDTLAVNADGSINSVVTATNLDIRDLTHVSDSVKVGDGTDFLAVNADGSINVVVSDSSPGTPINNYNTAAALAAAASSNHDYTVTALMTLNLNQVWASASGKLKIQVQIETGVATGVFNTFFVGFNSTAAPQIDLDINNAPAVAAGVRVRVIRTNLDNQAQDVYSTISGFEV